MCRVKRGSLRSGGRCNNRRIKWKNDLEIENLGNFRLKILGILRCGAIKHKWISLNLQTKAFYKSARIAKILNKQRWRLGATDTWKG